MSRIYLSPPDVSEADRERVAEVMRSPWVAPAGPELAAFEREAAGLTDRRHALAVNSGTAALHLALRLLEVGPGDEVVCPTFTFAASANPAVYCGARPVFIDADPATWNIDPRLLAEFLERRAREGRPPKAVVVVDLYGQCADMEPLAAACRKHGVPMVEDAAEALGARYRDAPAGSFGDLAFLSFNGNKIITSSGGGMLLCDSGDRIERAARLATQAREPVVHYEHRETGYNYRMSNVLAALGRSQLADLPRRLERRAAINRRYREALASRAGVDFMPVAGYGTPNHWLTCITLDPERCGLRPADAVAALEALDIEARPLWKPLHLQPAFRSCESVGGGVAEKLFDRGLCLPSGSGMTGGEIERVVEALAGLLDNEGA